MAEARRRAGFAQETKARRFVTEIFFADDLQCHGASKIDVERFVSDPHRTATQLDRFPVLVGHHFIMLEPMRYARGCCLSAVWFSSRLAGFDLRQREPREACTPDRIPLLRKTHYRNSGRRVCSLFS